MTAYRIDIYVPASHAEAVADAVFHAGAGRIGCYDRCCFTISGTGRFRPLPGSNPYAGHTGGDEFADEVKLEAVFGESVRDAVIAALKQAHPYETPAFQYWKVELE